MLWLAVALALFRVTFGAGITTHALITYRALNLLSHAHDYISFGNISEYIDIVSSRPEFWQSGSYFPDWGYGCLQHDRDSERTHWPPFFVSAIEYMKKNYERPWNTSAKNLVAFLFGAFSHSIVHSETGFLRYIANVNFNGSFDVAHPYSDLVGEFVTARIEPHDFFKTVWHFPTHDIINILDSMGMHVSARDFDYCMLRGAAGSRAVRTIGSKAFPYYIKKSSFMLDGFEHYYHGGIRDVSSWVAACWFDLIDWFESSTTSYDYKRCLIEKPFEHAPDAMLNITVEATTIDSRPAFQRSTETSILTNEFESKSMVHGKFDGTFEWTVESSPYFSHSLFHTGALKITTQSGSVLWEGSEEKARFGWSLAVLDMDQDGIDDLVVSVPSSGSTSLASHGKIVVYYGKQDRGLNITDFDIISGETESDGVRVVQFGETMKVFDYNNDSHLDLVVGVPMTSSQGKKHEGGVFVFKSSSNRVPFRYWHQAEVKLIHDDPFASFGSDIAFSTNTMFIGSPYQKFEGIRRGAVFVKSLVNEFMGMIVGTSPDSTFGHALLMMTTNTSLEFLICSAPSEHGNWLNRVIGKVYTVLVSSLTPGTNVSINTLAKSSVPGQDNFGRFGWVLSQNNGTEIVISEPWSRKYAHHQFRFTNGYLFKT